MDGFIGDDERLVADAKNIFDGKCWRTFRLADELRIIHAEHADGRFFAQPIRLAQWHRRRQSLRIVESKNVAMCVSYSKNVAIFRQSRFVFRRGKTYRRPMHERI